MINEWLYLSIYLYHRYTNGDSLHGLAVVLGLPGVARHLKEMIIITPPDHQAIQHLSIALRSNVVVNACPSLRLLRVSGGVGQEALDELCGSLRGRAVVVERIKSMER